MRLVCANQHCQHNLRFWRRVHWLIGWVYFHATSAGRPVAGMAVPRRALQSIICAGDVYWEGVSCSVGIHCKLPLVDLHDNMTAARYRDGVLMPWVEPHMDGHAVADRPIFQQGKAPPHIARLTTAFLLNAADDVLPWPSMSPDMNIIKHVWSHIASKINMMEHVPATAHDLRQCTHAIWRNLPQAYIQNLVWSCRRRVQAVIRQHGWITDY